MKTKFEVEGTTTFKLKFPTQFDVQPVAVIDLPNGHTATVFADKKPPFYHPAFEEVRGLVEGFRVVFGGPYFERPSYTCEDQFVANELAVKILVTGMAEKLAGWKTPK